MKPEHKISDLTGYLFQVRHRPEMYLGTKSVSSLYDHLQGYRAACQIHTISIPTDRIFFEEFHVFTSTFYKASPGDNWKELILQNEGGDEQRAFDLFFELYDLFLKAMK